MQYPRDKTARLFNISPKSTKPTPSPTKSLTTKDNSLKVIPKKPQQLFKISNAQTNASSNKSALSRLRTLGDELYNPSDDDYETPKFNIQK